MWESTTALYHIQKTGMDHRPKDKTWMDKKHREMQIKIIRYHYPDTRKAKIKGWQYQMLEKIWINQNTHILLAGGSTNGVTTLEINLEVSH